MRRVNEDFLEASALIKAWTPPLEGRTCDEYAILIYARKALREISETSLCRGDLPLADPWHNGRMKRSRISMSYAIGVAGVLHASAGGLNLIGNASSGQS